MQFVDWVAVAPPFQQIDATYARGRLSTYAIRAISMFNAALL
jgi:hypothetical protein